MAPGMPVMVFPQLVVTQTQLKDLSSNEVLSDMTILSATVRNKVTEKNC